MELIGKIMIGRKKDSVTRKITLVKRKRTHSMIRKRKFLVIRDLIVLKIRETTEMSEIVNQRSSIQFSMAKVKRHLRLRERSYKYERSLFGEER